MVKRTVDLDMLAKWVLLVGSEQGMSRYLHSLSGLADPVFLTLDFQGVLECSMIMKKLGGDTGTDNLRELLICQL